MTKKSKFTGRRAELSDAKLKIICDALRLGMGKRESAELAGISERQFYTWIRKGEREEKPIYCKFNQNVKKALAEFENEALKGINYAGKELKQWQALSWLLERKFPKRWGRTESRPIDEDKRDDKLTIEVKINDPSANKD